MSGPTELEGDRIRGVVVRVIFLNARRNTQLTGLEIEHVTIDWGQLTTLQPDVAEIGHTLAIDVTQFLVAAELIFGTDHRFSDDAETTRAWAPRQWLDWAVATQILPQLDEFLVDLREEQTVGSIQADDSTESAEDKLEDLCETLEQYKLARSKALLEDASESYQLL